MNTAFALIVFGLLVSFGAFVFAAINMKRMVRQPHRLGMESGFSRHIGAMVAAGFGGFCLILGVVIAIYAYVSK